MKPARTPTAATLLFDELGPRGRFRLRIATVVSVVVVLGLVVGMLAQLGHAGQLSSVLWSPLGDPSYLSYLGSGLRTTLAIGLSAAVLSMIAGMLGGLGRLSARRWISLPCAGAIELFRSIPLILLVYFFLIGGPRLGLHLPPFWTLTIPIVLHAGAVFAEIVRAGVNNLEKGQTAAGLAIGLRRGQVMRLIVLPQVLRTLRPALITQVIRTLKESSLGYVVSYPELLRNGQVLGEFTANFLQTYAVIAAIYIVINFLLSQLAEVVDRFQLPRRRGPAPRRAAPPSEGAREPAVGHLS